MLQPKYLRHFMLLSAFTVVVSTKAMVAVDPQAQRHMRNLSAEETRTDRLEERVNGNVFAKDGLLVEDVAPTLRAALSSDKEKVINHVFEKFHKNSEETNLFASEQYQKWASNVLDAHEDSGKAYDFLFRELKTHYNDHELATFILDGLASPKTKEVAIKYYNLQINDWAANKSARDVFRALKLNVDRGNVFKNPLLETYLSFARRLQRQDVSDDQPIYDDLVRTLKERFGLVRLIEMLGAPNVDLRDESIGNRVIKTLFIDEISGETHDYLIYLTSVFTDHAVAGSPVLSVWLSDAVSFLKEHDYEKFVTAMLTSLWEQRGVNVQALVTFLAAAQEIEISSEAALNTLEKLFVEWDNAKKSTDDVLTILGLNLAEMKPEDMTKGPLLETWYAFEVRRHATGAALLRAMLSQLTEEQLASMIFMKTSNPDVFAHSYVLEQTLFQTWLMFRIDADEAFVHLRLDKAGDKLLTHPAHPALLVWQTFVKAHGGPEPGALVTKIVKKYYHDSEWLLDMVNKEVEKEEFTSANALALTLKKYWNS